MKLTKKEHDWLCNYLWNSHSDTANDIGLKLKCNQKFKMRKFGKAGIKAIKKYHKK